MFVLPVTRLRFKVLCKTSLLTNMAIIPYIIPNVNTFFKIFLIFFKFFLEFIKPATQCSQTQGMGFEKSLFFLKFFCENFVSFFRNFLKTFFNFVYSGKIWTTFSAIPKKKTLLWERFCVSFFSPPSNLGLYPRTRLWIHCW